MIRNAYKQLLKNYVEIGRNTYGLKTLSVKQWNDLSKPDFDRYIENKTGFLRQLSLKTKEDFESIIEKDIFDYGSVSAYIRALWVQISEDLMEYIIDKYEDQMNLSTYRITEYNQKMAQENGHFDIVEKIIEIYLKHNSVQSLQLQRSSNNVDAYELLRPYANEPVYPKDELVAWKIFKFCVNHGMRIDMMFFKSLIKNSKFLKSLQKIAPLINDKNILKWTDDDYHNLGEILYSEQFPMSEPEAIDIYKILLKNDVFKNRLHFMQEDYIFNIFTKKEFYNITFDNIEKLGKINEIIIEDIVSGMIVYDVSEEILEKIFKGQIKEFGGIPEKSFYYLKNAIMAVNPSLVRLLLETYSWTEEELINALENFASSDWTMANILDKAISSKTTKNESISTFENFCKIHKI